MKKIFTTLFAGLMISAQVMAVSIMDVCGKYDGTLLLDSEEYPGSEVYLLPGVTDNTLTFVLPDFQYMGVSLGSIVLPNITMSEDGQFSIKETTLYLQGLLKLRATINILESYEEGGKTYTSQATSDHAGIVLEIAEPKTLPVPIVVCFAGDAVRSNNYALPNGGFEGAWTNNEPAGWHSFVSATGSFADFVKNNADQFKQSELVRPGSEGVHSVLLSSRVMFGVKANGNCTNGRINAGSMSADEASANYNFSDPDSVGFNTPFQGRPDSMVFWAKYIPGDRDAANEVNQARMSTIITTNARYQDPEAADYSEVKLAQAAINYPATASLGWQRISVPFSYVTGNSDKEPAYILTTFTTNKLQGGGTSTNAHPDSVFLDDVELIYNNHLLSLTRGEEAITFEGESYKINETYCDSCGIFEGVEDGVSAQSFFAYDALHKCVFVYVVADDFAQFGKYNVYRIDFTDTDAEGTSLDPKEPEIQGIEETITREARFEKVLINGQFLIRSNDAWYNASGVRVK